MILPTPGILASSGSIPAIPGIFCSPGVDWICWIILADLRMASSPGTLAKSGIALPIPGIAASCGIRSLTP